MARRPITPELSEEFTRYAVEQSNISGIATLEELNKHYYQKVKEEGYSRSAWDKYCMENFEAPESLDEDYGF